MDRTPLWLVAIVYGLAGAGVAYFVLIARALAYVCSSAPEGSPWDYAAIALGWALGVLFPVAVIHRLQPVEFAGRLFAGVGGPLAAFAVALILTPGSPLSLGERLGLVMYGSAVIVPAALVPVLVLEIGLAIRQALGR